MAMSEQQLVTPPEAPTVMVGVTLRCLLLAILLTFLASFWIDQSEVVKFFCQITESVPAVPAVAALVLLVLVNPFLRRLWRRLALSRREMLVVYSFLTVATSMAGCGIVRFFINTIPVLFYFDTFENNFADYQRFLPDWLITHNREAIRQLYEGSESGAIPWRFWITPILGWGALFLALWIAMMCLTVLFRRQWAEKEKLVYPLLYLPMEVTEGVDGRALVSSFFRNRIMWIGFIIAVLYNLSNILNAYNPSFLTIGKYYDIGRLFTERPWSALQPMSLHYRPEMIGFGYLVSTEVALSTWVFYLFLKLQGLLARMGGLEISGFPFEQEQSIGAYVALALALSWVARGHLADVFRKALAGRGSPVEDGDEPMTYRTAVIGGIVSLAGVVVWMIAAGMAPGLAIIYTVLILMVALVYTRIRAEVGVPLIWMFPYYQHYKAIKYFVNSRALLHNNEWRSATVFTTLVFLSRGYFPSLMGYQAEGYRLCQEVGIKSRQMTWVLIAALVAGFLAGVWLHLHSYYAYGAGGLRELEGWGAGYAKAEYEQLTGYAKGDTPADVGRIVATFAGFVQALALTGMRMVFLKFPLHPLGLAMATSYGDLVWGTFFIVWLIKSIVIKLGGMRGYRQLIPGFIGLALGHFFTAGVVYDLFGTFSQAEWYQRYGVWFG
jgi:hypothetical protein